MTPLSYISYDRMFYSIWCAKAERKIKNLKSGVFAKMVTGTYKSHVRSADRRGTWSFSQRGRSEGEGCRGGRFRGGAKGGGGVKEGQGGGSGGGVNEGSGGGVKEGQGGGGGQRGGCQRKSPGQRGSRKGGPKGGNVKKKKERDSRRKMILMKNQFQKEY